MNSPAPRRVHFNLPQMLLSLVDAQYSFCIWGRGTGKSEGAIAPRAHRCIWEMERSVGVFYADSFQQLLTKTLPPAIAGWERMNFQYGRDYVFGEKPPSWWPRPRQRRLDYKRMFSVRNGSAIMLASQEQRGSLNGPSIDYFIGDEGKFLKRELIEGEAVQAMRGNDAHYGHHPLHQSMLICSDMPISPDARWLLDKEDEMDEEIIGFILDDQAAIQRLQATIAAGVADSTRANYEREVAKLKHRVNQLRKGTVYYSEASALDNIDALGAAYFARMKKVLPKYLFDITILNKRPDRVEGGFYPGLQTDAHTYVAPPTTYALNHGWLKEGEVRDCRWDSTFADALPLDIACDYGTTLNCMVVGQLFGPRYNIDNCFYTKEKIKDLVEQFHRYYHFRSCKDIFFHYDHTAVSDSPILDYSFADEVMRQLKLRGWNVIPMYMGQAPAHHDKYIFWGRIFGRDEGMPELWINRENCEAYLLSMQLAPARQTRIGFEKDKGSERTAVDQSEATHLSDAGDQLIWGRFNNDLAMGMVPGGALFG